MSKKRGVGLILVADLPEFGKSALLMQRGRYNVSKMQQETWAGACQVTCHGGIEGNETPAQTLFRELCEELGREFARRVFWGRISRTMKEVSHVDTAVKEMVTYAAFLEDASLLRLVRLAPESGGFWPVKQAWWIAELHLNERVSGIGQMQPTMFPDEKEAVAKALELFAK